MFGYHQRHRSLISVREMEKSEKVEVRVERLEDEEEVPYTPRQKRNLTMIYLLFLAEAIMSSSLSSQIAVLLPSTTKCISADTSFLRSILECAYFFGSSAGIVWGCAADKYGRRKTAMFGLSCMWLCCLCHGVANDFETFALLRFLAGAISSATTVSGLAMLADVTHGSSSRTKVVARLPVVVVCGSIGPLASHMWSHALDGHTYSIFAKYPGLSGQIACGALVLAIAVAEGVLLEETLPSMISTDGDCDLEADYEKVAFLGQSLSNESSDSLNISIVEALNDENAPAPSSISLGQLLTAPTVMLLVASFSVLSLHASTFDTLLPHLGHTPSHNFGMGISCTWLKAVTMIVQVVAAIRILRVVPWIAERIGHLRMYRHASMAFPVLYIVVPLIALAVNATGAPPIASAIVSTIALLIKTTMTGASKVLALLLVLSAAPDASSTGTTVGVISISELFKALAVGVTGVIYYVSDGYSITIVNGSLWLALALIAFVGVAVTWLLRETPRVGADIPEECLVWQDVFDADSEEDYRL